MARTQHKLNELPTLCVACTKYNGQCSWSADFIPVQGWEAVPTVIKMPKTSKEPYCFSFEVKKCPEFVFDGWTVIGNRELYKILNISRKLWGVLSRTVNKSIGSDNYYNIVAYLKRKALANGYELRCDYIGKRLTRMRYYVRKKE